MSAAVEILFLSSSCQAARHRASVKQSVHQCNIKAQQREQALQERIELIEKLSVQVKREAETNRRALSENLGRAEAKIGGTSLFKLPSFPLL